MSLTVRPYAPTRHTPKPAPLTPLERLARTRIGGSSLRRETDLEAAVFEAARLYETPNRFMVWHWHAGTKQFTGFSVGGKLNAEK